MCTDPAMVAVHVPALAQEIRHVFAMGPDARDAVCCALAVGAAVACFANEATQTPTFVARFDMRSSFSSRWQARSIDSPRELSS